MPSAAAPDLTDPIAFQTWFLQATEEELDQYEREKVLHKRR